MSLNAQLYVSLVQLVACGSLVQLVPCGSLVQLVPCGSLVQLVACGSLVQLVACGSVSYWCRSPEIASSGEVPAVREAFGGVLQSLVSLATKHPVECIDTLSLLCCIPYSRCVCVV